ncbi:Kiwa anti-phage protein KwaB-like domain-containing protein [Xanthobacter sp. 91]|uniref:Kiwa anti-phage protein KwaB-like domain-containing protein n=1 Tax=Xanthobacter sp. 91 TaxID=1117244 RepID=UPI0009DD59B0|nr:Kiwa anti-phage protein KwaB-like domain-containing protein [Xanthobacter sp. 91]
MPLVDDAFSALADIHAAFEGDAPIGCHVFVFSPKTRERREEWHRIVMAHEVADRLIASARDSLFSLEARAADDQALAEFDFDAMTDGSIGVLKTEDAPAISDWLSAVPPDDWSVRFNGDEKILERVRFYATRINFSDGRILTLFRGSRGLNVILREKGAISAVFSREQNEMVEVDGAVVSFDGLFDFFSWDNTIFISNFRTFESVTNIRDVTMRKAAFAMDALAERFGLGANSEMLKEEVCKRTLLAKRLAAAHRNGVIDDIDPNNLVERAEEKGLRIRCRIENGNAHFEIDHNNKGEVEDFVDLLTDLFLRSPVTGREWEAVVKRPPRPRS